MQRPDPDWPEVAALQRGEEAALNRLMQRHSGPILGFISRMIGQPEDAQELAQETFVRAYFQIHTFRPKALFISWLYQIARNLCRDYFRSRAFKQRLLMEPLDERTPEIANPTKDSPHEAKRKEALQRALLHLPPKWRESLILTAIEGLSHEEAAKRLGLSAKAVEVRSYRARMALAKMLKNC